MDVGAAELLRGDVLSRRGLHEGRPADEDRARAADDHRLVRHRGDVRAAGRARAHDDGDLRDPERRQSRLVEEDPTEVVPVREHLGLEREEGAARVDEVDAGEPVLARDLLRAQVLLDREREVRAALDRRVVRDDDALATLDDADPRHDSCRRRLAVVEVPRRECVQLEERRARVDEAVDPLARGQLSAGAMSLDRLLAPAARDLRRPFAELRDELLHACPAPLERLVAGDLRRENAHRRLSLYAAAELALAARGLRDLRHRGSAGNAQRGER